MDAQREITAFWSTVAPGYEAHDGNVASFGTDEYEAWVRAIEAALPGSASDVIDVATGTGFIALIVATLGHRVTGIDLSREMLTIARAAADERGLSLQLRRGDAVAPAFPRESFDVVISRHLLWTLREPETAMRAWRALLRPGGRVVAFDGFWFPTVSDGQPEPAEQGGLFAQHYTAEIRAALPFMGLDRVEPVVETFGRAGYGRVEATTLESLVNEATGAVPYVVIARP